MYVWNALKMLRTIVLGSVPVGVGLAAWLNMGALEREKPADIAEAQLVVPNRKT